MKKLVLATTAAIVVMAAGPAGAADMALKGPRAVAAPGCAQFGGTYLGGHGGWGYYRHDHSDRGNLVQTIDDNLPTQTVQADGNGLGGAQIGWNWQRNCTVFGIEADWSWSGLKARETFFDGDIGDTQDALTVSSKLRWFGTVRTRAGIVVDNLLLYVTGGFAYAKFKRDYTILEDGPLTEVTFSSNNTRWGWTAGVGTEWAWSGNWSIKSEVLYMRFVNGDSDFTGTAGNELNFGVAGRNYTFGSQDEVWVARIGLNYRFGAAH